MPKKETIFIQIASYRDPELKATIKDCLEKAKYPENLVFCIAWQFNPEDEWDNLDEYREDPRFKIIEIHYKNSRGACWARNKIQQCYNSEAYTLQLDSHHRFTQDWDEVCINMLRDLQNKGYPKPILSSYLPSYDPKTGDKISVPWKLAFQRFLPEGPIFIVPHTMDNYLSLTEPIKARFYSAHFAFTLGKFCEEVPHDPNLYFHGEEPSLAMRAYTWGYDIFHPHRVIAWHEYTRDNKKKHWDDNTWVDENSTSYRRYRKLFSIGEERYDEVEFERYGLGKERSLGDYIRYSGVNPSKKVIQQCVLDDSEPPAPKFSTIEEFENSFLNYNKYCINLHKTDLPEDTNDFDFWVIAIKDKNKNDIVRLDANEQEVNNLIASMSNDWIIIWRDWFSGVEAGYWAVWPHSKSKGWLNLIERPL